MKLPCQDCGHLHEQTSECVQDYIPKYELSLNEKEQKELFSKLRKWLDEGEGLIKERLVFATEMESIFRLWTTFKQQQAIIRNGDSIVRQLNYDVDAYRSERDAAHHVIIEAGIKPGIDFPCRCDECATVARGMERAGYLQHDETKWWDS